MDKAVDFIAKQESFNPNCYQDGGGYSQGYGHKCLGGSISERKSRAILKKALVRLQNQIPRFNENTQIAVLSFLYNHPINQRKYIDLVNKDFEQFKKIIERKANSFVYINGIRQGGLTKRRQLELNLINKNVKYFHNKQM